MRVLVIGQASDDAALQLPRFDSAKSLRVDDFDAVYGKLRAGGRGKPRRDKGGGENPKDEKVQPWYDAVVRCETPHHFVESLRRLTRKGRRIEVLDLLDHGAPGGMMMGNKILFLVRDRKLEIGGAIAKAAAPHLSETGHLRLLGCETALSLQGQHLLLHLSAALGRNRVVSGTIDRVRGKYFKVDRGFTQSEGLLYSSLAALDFAAPNSVQRSEHVKAHSLPGKRNGIQSRKKWLYPLESYAS